MLCIGVVPARPRDCSVLSSVVPWPALPLVPLADKSIECVIFHIFFGAKDATSMKFLTGLQAKCRLRHVKRSNQSIVNQKSPGSLSFIFAFVLCLFCYTRVLAVNTHEKNVFKKCKRNIRAAW